MFKRGLIGTSRRRRYRYQDAVLRWILDYAAFFFEGAAAGASTIPRMSDSFMMRSSSPSILTSVPDHLPNSTRSPVFDFQCFTRVAGIVMGAGAGGDDFTFLRFFLGGVGDDDTTRGLFFGIQPADHDAVMQWAEFCHMDRS